MTLTSFAYLFFMPVVFVLYWLIFKRDKNWQNAFLLLSSLVFYAWWDWRFMALLLFTAGTSFLFGKLIAESDNEKRRKVLLVTVLLLNLGILVYYKYLGFFIQSFVDMFSLAGIELSVSTLNIVLPVGISFYTFAALSYDIDIYQRKVEPTKDWLAYFAFVTFFPSLLSGPISRATKQLPQYFQKREFSYDISIAACRMILDKKEGASMAVKMWLNMYRYNGVAASILMQSRSASRADTMQGFLPIKGNLKGNDTLMKMPDVVADTIDPVRLEISNRNLASEQAIKEVCAQYGVPVFDNRHLDAFRNSPEYFFDPTHINKEGTTVYTPIVIEQVRSVMEK